MLAMLVLDVIAKTVLPEVQMVGRPIEQWKDNEEDSYRSHIV